MNFRTDERPMLPVIAAAWLVAIYGSTILVWFVTILLLADPVLLVPGLIYLYWIIFGPGRSACAKATWKPRMRGWGVWRSLARYFPAKLIKTAELDPQHSYIFALHPHGILTCNSWMNFSSEATGFSKLFPGIEMHTGTISWNFITPVVREFCLMHGMCDVSRKTMVELLSTPGRALMVAIGGASEALLAAPGTMDLILNKRKGFIRVALTTGAHLVPVISFGENDLFDPIAVEKHSFTWYTQQLTKSMLGFCVPPFVGRGVLGYPYGLLPKPRPIVTVVGKPLPIAQWQGDLHSLEGTQLADKYHAQYVIALKELYEQHKDLYASDRVRSLKLVA
ncbi:hypothetical protein WJX79_000956 [Trebouxia sp. C0005]